MNLGQMIQEVYDQMDFNPSMEAYRDSVARRLAQHYAVISAAHPWLFLQTEISTTTAATVSGTDTINVATIAPGERRKVTFSGASAQATSESMIGQTFISSDGTEATIGATDTNIVYLTDQITAITSQGGWSIEYRRYPLPGDCVELLSVVDRSTEKGLMVFLDRDREDYLYLDKADGGDPYVTVEDEHLVLRPPVEAPTLASVATGGSLASGNEYEYMYTHYYAGRESPPSPSAAITLGTLDDQVNLTGLENTRYWGGSAYKDAGKDKYIYRRDRTNKGRWMHIATKDDSDTSHSDTGGLPTALYEDYDHVRYHQYHGPRQYIRLWPTASSAVTLTMRYLRRPRRLQADSDEPEWPVQYHRILIDRTLQDLFSQIGDHNAAKIHRQRAEEWLLQMRKRYLTRTIRRHRLGRWDRASRRDVWSRNFGDPSMS